MKLFDKYSINGNFTNYSLESMLKDFNIAPELINEILIRNSISSLTKQFVENLKQLNEKEDITNLLLKFFLKADKMKPITFNKSTLAELTGLSERQIDTRRRADDIPYIQLTGTDDKKGGRKIILFDPYSVTTALKKFETRKGTIMDKHEELNYKYGRKLSSRIKYLFEDLEKNDDVETCTKIYPYIKTYFETEGSQFNYGTEDSKIALKKNKEALTEINKGNL